METPNAQSRPTPLRRGVTRTRNKPPTKLVEIGNRKRVVSRPVSPRDKTPLVLDGQVINREDIPPIAFPVEENNIRPASPEKQVIIEEEQLEIPSIEEGINEEKREVPVITEETPPIIRQEEQSLKEAPRQETPPEERTPQQGVNERTPQQGVNERTPQQATQENREETPRRPRIVRRNNPPSSKPPPKKRKKSSTKKLSVPEFNKMTPQQRVEALVSYRKKFMNLRDAFPGLGVKKIPEDLEPTPENLILIHEEYDGYMTHILISEDVSQSMIILILVLGGIELFLTKVLGLPGSRYVIKQFKLINKYRALLYELGEERLANSGGTSPPLVRLAYIILLTSIATVGIRLFESSIGKAGADIAEDIIYGILGGGGSDMPNSDQGSGNIFDLNGVLKFAGNFISGNNPAPRPEPRGPVYNE